MVREEKISESIPYLRFWGLRDSRPECWQWCPPAECRRRHTKGQHIWPKPTDLCLSRGPTDWPLESQLWPSLTSSWIRSAEMKTRPTALPVSCWAKSPFAPTADPSVWTDLTTARQTQTLATHSDLWPDSYCDGICHRKATASQNDDTPL